MFFRYSRCVPLIEDVQYLGNPWCECKLKLPCLAKFQEKEERRISPGETHVSESHSPFALYSTEVPKSYFMLFPVVAPFLVP